MIDDRIERSFRDDRYRERLWYQVNTGGKRLRPGLVLLVGELCGCDRYRLLDCGVGVELLHTFSLIHDDFVDGDRLRRDEPAFWVRYGQDDAVNIGDMLLAHALVRIPDEGTTCAAMAVRKMTVGQQLDFALADRRDVTEDEYMEMVTKKMGALFDLCLDLPQILTGTDLDIDGYSALWSAFQIRDDLLNFEAEKGRKTIGNDVRAGKRTLIAIHADDERVYDLLDKPVEQATTEDIATAEISSRRQTVSFTSASACIPSLPRRSPRLRRCLTLPSASA